MQTKSKSGLFLIELILAIMFFSIASAVCIQIFVTADMLSEKGSNTSMAITVSESAAEVLKGTKGSAKEMAELLGAQVLEDEEEAKLLKVYYDSKWNRLPAVSSTKTAYCMQIAIETESSQTGKFVVGEIQVLNEKKAGEVIYNLSVKKFIG